jgi:N-acetylglucosaminyldiphosphoundecaprenol N-acetyl-beta-D-mannosaminyltransferase
MNQKLATNIVRVGGIPTSTLGRKGLAELLASDYATREKNDPPKLVFSSNGQGLAEYHRDSSFAKLIDEADIVHADGMSIVFASFFGRERIAERVATTDFFHDAATVAQAEGISFYFLGASQARLAKAIANVRELYPRLQIAGYRDGYFSCEEEPEIVEKIRNSGADVLWVGLGRPLQEAFCVRNKHQLQGLTWLKTCGGLFDFLSADVLRAPKLMQQIGLEWLFRFFREPRRLGRRYVVTNLLAVFYLVTKK